jgi:hypothetical protein
LTNVSYISRNSLLKCFIDVYICEIINHIFFAYVIIVFVCGSRSPLRKAKVRKDCRRQLKKQIIVLQYIITIPGERNIWSLLMTVFSLMFNAAQTCSNMRWNLIGLSAVLGVCIEPTFRGPSRSSSSSSSSSYVGSLMVMTGMVLDTLVQFRRLMRVIPREDFIEYSHRESPRAYIYVLRWCRG